MNLTPALIEITEKWNYEKSVALLHPRVSQWKKLSVDLVRELFLAHAALARRGGDQKREGSQRYTWSQYCTDIGISRYMAEKFLNLFEPAELSPTGQDRLIDPEEQKQLIDVRLRENESRMAQVIATGERPQDWTDAEEKEYKKRLQNQKAAAIVSGTLNLNVKPRKDFFAQAMKQAKNSEYLQLKTKAGMDRQNSIFLDTYNYIMSFKSMEERIPAAINLSKKLRDFVNEACELELQQFEKEE